MKRRGQGSNLRPPGDNPGALPREPSRSGPWADVLLRSWCDGRYCSTTELPEHGCSGQDSNLRPVDCRSITATSPARSRSRVRAGSPGFEPGPARLELAMLPLHHEPLKRTTRVERASPEWRSGALPTELHPREKHARLESNQRTLPSQDSAHPLSYGRKEPPAGIEPTLRPYEGRVLAVDTTEAGLPGGDHDAAPLLGCDVAHRL